MMNSSSRRALYSGVCGGLRKRVVEHKTGKYEGFTSKYRAHRLVYYEIYQDVRNAIHREKQVKNWRREKKVALVNKINPEWRDLSAEWFAVQDSSVSKS